MNALSDSSKAKHRFTLIAGQCSGSLGSQRCLSCVASAAIRNPTAPAQSRRAVARFSSGVADDPGKTRGALSHRPRDPHNANCQHDSSRKNSGTCHCGQKNRLSYCCADNQWNSRDNGLSGGRTRSFDEVFHFVFFQWIVIAIQCNPNSKATTIQTGAPRRNINSSPAKCRRNGPSAINRINPAIVLKNAPQASANPSNILVTTSLPPKDARAGTLERLAARQSDPNVHAVRAQVWQAALPGGQDAARTQPRSRQSPY